MTAFTEKLENVSFYKNIETILPTAFSLARDSDYLWELWHFVINTSALEKERTQTNIWICGGGGNKRLQLIQAARALRLHDF